MITLLASLAARVGVPEPLRKAAGTAGAIVALMAVLALAKCSYDRSLIQKHEATQAAKIAPVIRAADEHAAGSRITDLKRNLTDEAAERAAVAPLPDAGLSDRQRARACAILVRQRTPADRLPAACRP